MPPAPKLSNVEEDKIAADYFEKFNKSYPPEEIELRKKILIDLFYEIEAHNERFKRGEELYERGLNQFSDLTDDEFIKYWTGSIDEGTQSANYSDSPPPLPPQQGRRRKRSVAPTNFNWGPPIVQPVQNQGECGSCYVS